MANTTKTNATPATAKEMTSRQFYQAVIKANVSAILTEYAELAIKKMDGIALITADHGNADKMIEEDGSPFTAHTTNLVPFCVVNHPCVLRDGGRLADIAPTMLQLLGLSQPAEMDGKSLIR